MTIILLVMLYVVAVGIGIPDSIFGVAWPVIYQEFGVGVSYANLISATVAGGTIISSFYSARLIKRFGGAMVTAVSTAMTTVAMLGYSFSTNIWVMCLCAIPLGLGAGGIDSAINSFVAMNYKASHLSYMQCFCGIGVTISPFIMSLALKNNTWRFGYGIGSILQISITIVAFLAIPLWKRIQVRSDDIPIEEETEILSLKQMLKNPAIRWVCAFFLFGCGLEVLCGSWCSTYLVDYYHLQPDIAASITLFYYFGMALGRFLSGLISEKVKPQMLLTLSLSVILVAFLVLQFSLPAELIRIVLLFAGIGVGPLFPNMVYLTTHLFPRNIVLSISGIQYVATYAGVMFVPVIFGMLAQYIGVYLYSNYLLVMSLIVILSVTMTFKYLIKNEKK